MVAPGASRTPPVPVRVSTTRVGPIGVKRDDPVGPSHPVMSTRTSVSALVHTHNCPVPDSAAIVVFATIWPATKLTVDVSGRRSEHG